MTRWLLVVTIALVLGAPAPALAQDAAPSWAITPGEDPNGGSRRTQIRLDLDPGEVVRDSVEISNLTDGPLSLRLFAADAYNTPRDGAFALRAEDEPKDDVGAWVLLSSHHLIVPPSSRTVVPFALRVPANATPGDHVGGIVALNTAPESTTRAGDAELDVLRAVGVRIYAQVRGRAAPELDATVGSVQIDGPWSRPVGGTGHAEISYEVRNAGNTRLRPTAVLIVRDVFGREVQSYDPRPLPEILPGGTIRITEVWPSLPAAGFAYTAEVVVSDGAVQAKAERTAWDLPWALLAPVAVFDILLILRGRRKRARPRPR